MDWSEIVKYFIAMIVITNPLAAVPIFIGLSADSPRAEQKRSALVAGFAVLVILLLVNWIGVALLKFFGIEIGSFKIAGGIIILLMGLAMLHSKQSNLSHSDEEHEHHKNKEGSIAVVPLALPLMAGPGAISTVIVWAHDYGGITNHLIMSGTDIVLAFVLGTALYFAGTIGKVLGPAGIKIAVRIMGMILAAIAVQMIYGGLVSLFHHI